MEYVYLIREEKSQRFKIGRTNNLLQRLKNLQTGNSKRLILWNYFECHNASRFESILHNLYNKKRIRNEFFKLSKGDLILISFLHLVYEKQVNHFTFWKFYFLSFILLWSVLLILFAYISRYGLTNFISG